MFPPPLCKLRQEFRTARDEKPPEQEEQTLCPPPKTGVPSEEHARAQENARRYLVEQGSSAPRNAGQLNQWKPWAPCDASCARRPLFFLSQYFPQKAGGTIYPRTQALDETQKNQTPLCPVHAT